MPRVHKDKILQQSRSKEMAEVFTPSWLCNAQNNLADNAWFGSDSVFNKEILLNDGSKTWLTNKEKITFPEDKTWQDYVRDTRLEISCGEAPSDDNSDVIVTFSDDKKYIATFFTYDNVRTLTEKNKRTGELLSGKILLGE